MGKLKNTKTVIEINELGYSTFFKVSDTGHIFKTTLSELELYSSQKFSPLTHTVRNSRKSLGVRYCTTFPNTCIIHVISDSAVHFSALRLASILFASTPREVNLLFVSSIKKIYSFTRIKKRNNTLQELGLTEIKDMSRICRINSRCRISVIFFLFQKEASERGKNRRSVTTNLNSKHVFRINTKRMNKFCYS